MNKKESVTCHILNGKVYVCNDVTYVTHNTPLEWYEQTIDEFINFILTIDNSKAILIILSSDIDRSVMSVLDNATHFNKICITQVSKRHIDITEIDNFIEHYNGEFHIIPIIGFNDKELYGLKDKYISLGYTNKFMYYVKPAIESNKLE